MSEKWKTILPNSRRYPFSADTSVTPSTVRVTVRQPLRSALMREAACSGVPAASTLAYFGSRLRLRGAGTGVARRVRTCSRVRGVRQPTSEMNSST